MGRPTKYNDRMAEKILVLAAEGKTDAEIALEIGIAYSNFRVWKNRYPSLQAALKEAKNVVDELVEISLFKKATGYSGPAIKFFCHNGEIISKRYTQHFAPDTTAAIFWLKNRQPERWRDTYRQEHTGKDGGPIEAGQPQIVITLPSNGREAKESKVELKSEG